MIRIDLIQNYRIFASNFSTSKLLLHLDFLKIMSPSGIPLLLIATPCHDALLLDKSGVPLVVYKKLKLPCQVIFEIMLPVVLGGFTLMPSLLFRPDPTLLISVQLFRLPKGYFPINVSLYINLSNNLVRMNKRIVQTRSSYCDIFRQQGMFHPRAFGVFRFIVNQFLSVIFPKRSVQQWCWCYIVKVILVKESHLSRSFSLFDSDLLKMFACHFLLFARVFAFTLINFVFVIRNYLTIFLSIIFVPTLFFLCN